MDLFLDDAHRTYGNLYKVSLVKFLTPGHIIFDVDRYRFALWSEAQEVYEIIRRLTEYWKDHHNDPIEGRKFYPGEVVAVKLGAWRPALISGFRYVGGMHIYEVILLDCGQFVEVHRMSFRHIPHHITLRCRYMFFHLIDLFPIEAKTRRYGSWNIPVCEELKSLFDVATCVKVMVLAKQTKDGYERLFGNIYIQINMQVIDVREKLIKDKEAIEEPNSFRKFYDLKDEDFCYQHPKDEEELQPNRDVPKMVPGKIDYLTSKAPDVEVSFKNSEDTSISYKRKSEKFQQRMLAESCIAFTSPQSHGNVIDTNEYRKPEEQDNHVKEEDVEVRISENDRTQESKQSISPNFNNKVDTSNPNLSTIYKKGNSTNDVYYDLPEIQVATGELSKKLAKLFVPLAPSDSSDISLASEPTIRQRMENKCKMKEERAQTDFRNTNESKSPYDDLPEVQVATRQMCKVLAKLFTSPDKNSLLHQSETLNSPCKK